MRAVPGGKPASSVTEQRKALLSLSACCWFFSSAQRLTRWIDGKCTPRVKTIAVLAECSRILIAHMERTDRFSTQSILLFTYSATICYDAGKPISLLKAGERNVRSLHHSAD